MRQPYEELVIKSTEKSTDFPATTLKAFLKQVNTSVVDEKLWRAIEKCFPYFANDPNDWVKSLEIQDKQSISQCFTSRGIYNVTQGRFRRYAGGRDLPAGRYFSVCRDEHGNDGGTLCYELMSYWDCTTGVYVGLTDSTVHWRMIEQSNLVDIFKALHPIVIVTAFNINELKISSTGEPYSTGKKYLIPLPVRLIQITCDNVLDLRLPAAQEWLASRSSVSGTSSSFGDLLPNLLSPLPGGNNYHQNLGKWLRAHGCQGLVFPSARRDITVDATDERVINSDGWNFVNYADARIVHNESTIGPPFPWLTPNSIGIKIYTGTSERVRSWRVRGTEVGEWGRIYYEVRRSRGEAPEPSYTFNPYENGRAMCNAKGTVFGDLEPDE